MRAAAVDDRDEVTAVAARAFWDDPLFGFFCRGPLHQHRFMASLLGAYLAGLWDLDAPTWTAEGTGRPRGVACWLPPGATLRPSPRSLGRAVRHGPALAGVRHHVTALRLLAEVDRVHPAEPHWYLALLATDPGAQGRGLGSALLRPVLDRCDEEGVVAYLETQTSSNVAWYARAGFVECREVRVAGAPPVWCLRREPRPTC